MTRTCRACSTRLADGLVADRHPLCRLDPPPTGDEVRTAIALLNDVLGIEVLGGIQPAADEGPGISNRAHGRDLDHHGPAADVCPECDHAVPAGVVRHPRCYRRHVDGLRRTQSDRKPEA